MSLFTSLTGVGIVVPLLPVYAHSIGAKGIYIGLIFGAFSISRTFFLPYFGRLSDQKGRKPFIITGLFCYAIVSVAFIYAIDIFSIIALRFFQGIASAMLMPVVQAYVGEITPKGKEGTTMGLFNMSIFGSLSIGPVVGGFVNDAFSLKGAFICMGTLSFISFVFALVMLPPTSEEKTVVNKKAPPAWKEIINSKLIAGIFSFRLAYTTCIGIIWSFLPVYADHKFNLSSSQIGILITLSVLIGGALQLPMGFLADRFNKNVMIITGGIIISASVFYYNFAAGFWQLILASTFFSIGGGISMPAIMALSVIKGSEEESMGSVIALLTMAHSLGMLIGSIISGFIMDFISMEFMFVIGGWIMLVGSLLFTVLNVPGLNVLDQKRIK